MKKQDIADRLDEKIKLDPGKGKRTPDLWGEWLRSRWGFQRQMLQAMQVRPLFQGLGDDPHKLNQLARRRAKNKVARRSRRVNRMRAH